MLEIKEVSLLAGKGNKQVRLLSEVSAIFPRNHFAAVIGPSGCGKTTLLKTVAGIACGEEEGTICWDRRDLSEEDFEPSEIGYVPQFSIAHPELTVQESVETALRLRVGGLDANRRASMAASFLGEVGMASAADRRVAVLSGGQQRRLSLAMEIASRPHILLCDEVTSGLDARSEDEIVRLLHALSRTGGRLVLSVTHSLQHLHLYDSVMVLYGGCLAYHGPPSHLSHYFQIRDAADLYGQLEKREPCEWALSWKKHHAPFRKIIEEKTLFSSDATGGAEPWLPQKMAGATAPDTTEVPPNPTDYDSAETILYQPEKTGETETLPPAICPDALSQFWVLLCRRTLIFSRNKPQLLMQAGLVFGFPLLVAVFAWHGLPNVKNVGMSLDANMVSQLLEAKDFLLQATKIGTLVSGIVMFQVILLTLMGANNAGREIAGERLIFEKEKLSGLRPASYVASKAFFLGGLVLLQSVWMGVFVHFTCGFPGDFPAQLAFLLLVNAAMTSVCLALSSWLENAEQSSLASIYLVGFQLPLSGAVLALPDPIGTIARPFIAAYWSWSGILQTLRDERYYDIVQVVAQSPLSPVGICALVLLFHIFAGIVLAWWGCLRSRLA